MSLPLAHLPSGSASTAKQPGRLLIGVLHGTSTGGVARSKGTPLPQLIKFIDRDKEDVVPLSIAGVGSGSGVSGKFSAALGIGFNNTVVMLYKSFSENYRAETWNRDGDRLLIMGFSRGGAAALKFAKLMNAVGVVIDGDDKVFRKLYQLLAKEQWTDEDVKDVKDGYNWVHDVKIAELLIFDPVSTLGVPATGIGRVLKVLPGWSKNSDRLIVVPPNVLHTSVVAMLHDPRAAYENSTLCIPVGSKQVLRQRYFFGRHIDSMSIGPMSFQVQNLKDDLNLSFAQRHLDDYFPGTATGRIIPDWVFNPIKPVNSILLAILGNKPRMPARNSRLGFVTNEEVSSSVRHRGYGVNQGDNKAVEGFYQTSDPTTGRVTWVQTSTNRSKKTTVTGSGSDVDDSANLHVIIRIPEAVERSLERQLSGSPMNG